MASRLKVFLTLLKYLRACLRYLMLSCQSLTTGLQPSGNHQLSSTLVLHWSYWLYWLNPSVAHPATTSVATIYAVLTISSPGFDCKQLPAYILLFMSKHQLRQDVPKCSECPSTIACICLEWSYLSYLLYLSDIHAHVGVILSSVLRNADGRSPFLLVLDAGTFKEVARVEFDGVDMHKDIHGLFTPFSSPHSCWLVSPQSWFTGQFEILTWLNTLLDVLPPFVYACIF